MDTDSSDSENAIHVKQLLEATDTTLLNDSLFQLNTDELDENLEEYREIPKSQRYLLEEQKSSPNDIVISGNVQKYMAKKLSESLAEKYEFFQNESNVQSMTMKNSENYLKLLRDADCYVKSYEDYFKDIHSSSKRIKIKTRIIDQTICTEEEYKSLAVDGFYVLNGSDMKFWSKRKERSNKVFYYKNDKNGVLHLKEAVNEFTKLRHRNLWHENKIRNFQLRKKIKLIKTEM